MPLPRFVFSNVSQVFSILFRAALSPTGDRNEQPDEPINSDNIEELMRATLFTRLFVFKGAGREVFHELANTEVYSSLTFWKL